MNSKDPEIVECFIELRSKGWTFDRLVEKLHVSKPTLIEWSRKHHHRIANLRVLQKEVLADKYQLSAPQCLEQLGALLQRLNQELERRNLADLPTHRLIALLPLLQAQAAKLTGPLQLSTPISADAPAEDQFPAPLFTWEV